MFESIWVEFVNQLKAKGYDLKRGVDATFITSDPCYAKSDDPSGGGAKIRRM